MQHILGYGVMVTLQILVLSFLVRVRVSQPISASSSRRCAFIFPLHRCKSEKVKRWKGERVKRWKGEKVKRWKNGSRPLKGEKMVAPINLSTYQLINLSTCQLVKSLTCQLVNLSTRQLIYSNFCLLFSKFFNIMTTLFLHQLLTRPQIIDSREGWFWCKRGIACACGKMNFYLN